MPTYYLGAFGYGPNSSAALLRDGQLVAFAEEERFNRIKTAPHHLPIASILYCLSEAGIGVDQVHTLAFGWDAPRYATAMPEFYARQRKNYAVDAAHDQGFYEDYLLSVYNPQRITTDLRLALANKGQYLDPAKIRFLSHHLCHAASTFFASGFPEATILTIDGSGEELTTLIAHGRGSEITELHKRELPHTLGGFYATFTEYLGFIANMDEGKLMGLAPYGRYSEALQEKLKQILTYDEKTAEFTINPRLRFLGPRTHGRLFTDAFVDLFGPPRRAKDKIEDRHRDLAFNVQWLLEKVAAGLARRAIAMTGVKSLCLAGGVAMNCKMNGVLAQLPEVDRIYVQPASADNGIALGAAYLAARANGCERLEPMAHAYWGPSYSDADVERALREAKIDYRRSADAIGETARLLNAGRIVGWFQGRMEIGARALGCRSILANPLIQDMRSKLNLEVKHREDWRPFCPSLPVDDYAHYFENKPTSDHMILAFEMMPKMQPLVPAVVHVDGTARPQSVRRETNPRFYDLLKSFGRLASHPVLVNTSFNIQGEPVVCTPSDAVRCFGGTGIDALVINDFIALKPGVSIPS